MLSNQNEQAVPVAAQFSSIPSNSIRVLVVDDDHNLVMIVSLILERFGMHVDAANCGPAAIECLGKCRYDVVVTDLEMPDMDGCTLAAWIKQKIAHTQVIIMTGRRSFEVVNKINAGVADRWLFKPFRGYELRHTLSALVDTTSSAA